MYFFFRLLSQLLRPFSWIYCFIILIRNYLYNHTILTKTQFNIPIISIGNITTGGTGKSPMVIYIAKQLIKIGYKPGIISRGYGRKSSGLQIVHDGKDLLADVNSAGDEAYLIADHLNNVPIIVCKNRINGINQLINFYSVDIIIMDDGFQHRKVNRDIDILMISSNDQIIFSKENSSFVNQNFGYVFQSSRLLPWLNIKENIELVTKEGADNKDRIENLLENFGLKEFENYYPKSISGGMRRKVSLARALINQPKVLLMDEPFISLDQPTSYSLYDVLLKYWNRNPITIIFITHNLKEAILLGDRIIFFSQRPGTVVFDHKVRIKKTSLNVDSKEVEVEYDKLTKKHPKLLNGLL